MSVSEQIARIGNAIGSSFAAILAKGADVENINAPYNLSSDIESISTSGLNNIVGRDVIFIDYDGTEVATYSAETFLSLNRMPPNPVHNGLISQGWNWTVSQIRNQLTNVGGEVIVGQMYVTESGATEIDCSFLEDDKSPYLQYCLNGTAVIDWGDGSSDTVNNNNINDTLQILHEYAHCGDYTIKILVTEGTGGFFASNSFPILRKMDSVPNASNVYSSKIKSVRVGMNWSLNIRSFINCYNLESVTIPNDNIVFSDELFKCCNSLKAIVIPPSVTGIEQNEFRDNYSLLCASLPPTITYIRTEAFIYNYALRYITIPYSVQEITHSTFSYCCSLESVIIPNTVTTIGNSILNGCDSLKRVALSNGITKISNNEFQVDKALKEITIPNTVTSIGIRVFETCCSLESIVIPDSVESIEISAFYSCNGLRSITLPTNENFTKISDGTFGNCYSLVTLTIPSSVNQIVQNAFSGCKGMQEYHFLSTTPPTLGNTNVFADIPSNCIIYVPYSEDHSILNAYQTATNWSTYASYMQEEPLLS